MLELMVEQWDDLKWAGDVLTNAKSAGENRFAAAHMATALIVGGVTQEIRDAAKEVMAVETKVAA